MASSKCDICGHSYEEENITILGHIGETWILQMFCGSCHSQSLLAAEIDESDFNKSNPVASLTDLQTNEIKKFEEIEITFDDLLDIRNFLRSFDGNFGMLFG